MVLTGGCNAATKELIGLQFFLVNWSTGPHVAQKVVLTGLRCNKFVSVIFSSFYRLKQVFFKAF